MSLQSPLGQVRGLGSAKQGVHHWWVQRLTSIALVPLSLWFIFSMTSLSDYQYNMTIAWFQEPWNATLMVLFVFTAFYHMFLGMQVVIEDYVEPEWVKIASIILVKFIAVLAGASSIIAVLRIHLGL